MPNTFLYAYLWAFMAGPWAGAALAGLFHMWHKTSHEPQDVRQGFAPDASDPMIDKTNQ